MRSQLLWAIRRGYDYSFMGDWHPICVGLNTGRHVFHLDLTDEDLKGKTQALEKIENRG